MWLESVKMQFSVSYFGELLVNLQWVTLTFPTGQY